MAKTNPNALQLKNIYKYFTKDEIETSQLQQFNLIQIHHRNLNLQIH